MIENFTPQGFINEHALCEAPQPADFIFSFTENNILLLKNGQLPQWQDLKELDLPQTLELYSFGVLNKQRCLLANPPVEKLGENAAFILRSVRSCHESLSEPLFRLAGLGRELHHWRETQVYCGHCGSKTQDKKNERAKICPACQRLAYPHVAPCIIVLVTRGPSLLLARSPHFQAGVYSTLAGFIEPGESVENAVYREVKEEAGVCIKNVRYLASQPWPFPNSLMLGFLAEYESGELVIDPSEIEDAQWFEPKALPKLPSTLSISRLLIENHLQQQS